MFHMVMGKILPVPHGSSGCRTLKSSLSPLRQTWRILLIPSVDELHQQGESPVPRSCKNSRIQLMGRRLCIKHSAPFLRFRTLQETPSAGSMTGALPSWQLSGPISSIARKILIFHFCTKMQVLALK